MKISLPVNEKELNSDVCVSFGRTPYFLVFDSNTKKVEFIDNSAKDSMGGAGIKAAQIIVNEKIDVLITPRCGDNAYDVLKLTDIVIYKSINASADDNIKAYLNGSLNLLNEIHGGFHNHGSH